MKNLNRFLFLLTIGLLSQQAVSAQPTPAVEDALFWEITGKDLKQPSWVLGTFHLLDNRYTDSLTNVMDKFNKSKTVVGEILIDTSMASLAMKLMTAAQLENTTLDKLLSAEDYQKTATLLQELTGYNLSMFNTINPITIQLLLMASIQQKYYPTDPLKDVAMDMYFQKLGRTQHKTVVGLESFDDQVGALYSQFSYERQAELLSSYVQNKEKAFEEVAMLNKHYREQKLSAMEKMMADQYYNKKEVEILLNNRNKNWMTRLPELMKQQSTFIAVGALHLAGENGLVNLLRKQGYTVRPIKLK